jgi:iron complex transport system substrate-binding protein
MKNRPAQRIVCLSAEAADWLWRIGAWPQVVGVTAFFIPAKGVPKRPRVSGFSAAHGEKITALKPDLVITFSDVQTHVAADLIRRGLSVLATNQRTILEIEETLVLLSRLVGCEREAKPLLREFRERLKPVTKVRKRPHVYFEEWNEPFVAGISWISELIERAGGEDIFANLRERRAACERVVSSEQICRANPDIILASWCGKPVNVSAIALRPGWHAISAVQKDQLYEIAGANILQPGFRLVFGYELIKNVLRRVATLE